jgi:hypothetical protein
LAQCSPRDNFEAHAWRDRTTQRQGQYVRLSGR